MGYNFPSNEKNLKTPLLASTDHQTDAQDGADGDATNGRGEMRDYHSTELDGNDMNFGDPPPYIPAGTNDGADANTRNIRVERIVSGPGSSSFGFQLIHETQTIKIVTKNTPASRAGLKPEMNVVAVNGRSILPNAPDRMTKDELRKAFDEQIMVVTVFSPEPSSKQSPGASSTLSKRPPTKNNSNSTDINAMEAQKSVGGRSMELNSSYHTRLLANEHILGTFDNFVVTTNRVLVKQPIKCCCLGCFPSEEIVGEIFLQDITYVAMRYNGLPLFLIILFAVLGAIFTYYGVDNGNISTSILSQALVLVGMGCFIYCIILICSVSSVVSIGVSGNNRGSWTGIPFFGAIATPDPFTAPVRTVEVDELRDNIQQARADVHNRKHSPSASVAS